MTTSRRLTSLPLMLIALLALLAIAGGLFAIVQSAQAQQANHLNVDHPTKRAILHRNDSRDPRCQPADKKRKYGYWQSFDDPQQRSGLRGRHRRAPASVLEVQAHGNGNWIEAAGQRSPGPWSPLSWGSTWGES